MEIASDSVSDECLPWGHSGVAYDQMEFFSVDDIARALVFDRTNHFLAERIDSRTQAGVLYFDWVSVLRAAAHEAGNPLHFVKGIDGEEWEFERWHVWRPNLREWCKERQMRPKFLFQKVAGNPAEMPYLNPDHADYATELAIAIAAWSALFADDAIQRNRGVKDQIAEWLQQNHPALSNSAIERIAGVVNPDQTKKGGAPKAK